MPIGKITCHGIEEGWETREVLQFSRNQVWKGLVKDLMASIGIWRRFQNIIDLGQSLKRCDKVSVPELHIGHSVDIGVPLENRVARVGTLSQQQSQRKALILGLV
jgi:hypothetical protein